MAIKEEIVDFLEFSAGVVEISNALDSNNSVVKNHYISEIINNDFGIDRVYFSGDFPSIYFKRVDTFSDEVLKNIAITQKKIWNQGKVPMLYVDSPTEIRIYNCYGTPLNPDKELDKLSSLLELAAFNKELESDINELKNIFGKVSVETGKFWSYRDYSNKIDNQKRVNKALISNLKRTRSQLTANGVSTSVIHDLMLRSLFILYLEDRKATDKNFYSKFQSGATSYFDLLFNFNSTYKLFSQLEDHFNGSINPVTSEEESCIGNNELECLRQCFWSDSKYLNQHKLFDWRVFDFSIIPIELISEIYEEFLAEEEGENQKSKDGTYYTPHALVEFILNKELPYPGRFKGTDNYNIKVLDPTCGSGIFLVESLNRLLDRWKYKNPDKQFDFKTIKRITENNIFGIEKNPEAIKVAAFSIYLAMLDRLQPKTLWEKKSFPPLIFNPKDKQSQGKNLFCMSSLSKGPFEKIKFNLIVGNPPFKRGDINQEGKEYLNNNNFAQEYVLAFIHRATILGPKAKIALVSASKILFNKTSGYVNFREFLFKKNYVDSIYNFSILRKANKSDGGSLFASAVGPACVLFFKTGTVLKKSPKLLYCAPKTALKNNIIDGIAIDSTDIKLLPRHECEDPKTVIWKVGMWATIADYFFIKKLSQYTNLESVIKEKNWDTGVGFQLSQPQSKENLEISKIPMIDASKIERYYSRISNTKSITTKMFRRIGAVNTYKSPHILIKEGQSDKKFCASYLDFDCSFTSTVFGIHGENEIDLKVLTAYLNSSFASYYLFLTASTWGIERERVKPNELLKLPDFCINISEKSKEKIAGIVDQIIELKKSEILSLKIEIGLLEKKIDELFSEEFSFSKNEKHYIQDTLNYSLDLFQQGSSSVGYKPCSDKFIKNYAKSLIEELNIYLAKGSNLTAWASVYSAPSTSPLTVVSINLNKLGKKNHIEVLNPSEWRSILSEIDRYSYEKYSESIYFRKNLLWFNNDKIILIKPNEKRFWTITMADTDLKEIISKALSE